MTSHEQIPALNSDIEFVYKSQGEFFRQGHTKSVSFRKQQLKHLDAGLTKYKPDLMEALAKDLNRPLIEAMPEVMLAQDEIKFFLKNLDKWAKPKRHASSVMAFPSKAYTRFDPYGRTLIFAPWNYPLMSALGPLVGVIGAGNCAVIKPSELAPHSSKVLSELIATTFDPAYVAVIEGGVDTANDLLAYHWDYIFLTGSPAVGRLVMQAAAKNLTPVTLELGGKCPAIVDETADIEVSARRIAHSKVMNAGQTCAAADYAVVHQDVKAEFIDSYRKAIQLFFAGDAKSSPDFGRMINSQHTKRVAALIDQDKVVMGGEVDAEQRYVAPTLMANVQWHDPVMQEEIFGPILPMLTYQILDDLIPIINDRPKPLALYLFSKNKSVHQTILEKTSSGGVCINDIGMHGLPRDLPFGGVGESGMGAYQGYASFTTSSHLKSYVIRPTWGDMSLRYPPYKFIHWLLSKFN